MKPLAELRGRSGDSVRAGTLRRGDLEAFGALLERIGEGPVLVTGAGDGRLAASTGLASASAAAGSRTALVDCDLEEPTLAGALGLAAEPGLHEYLRWEAAPAEVLQPLTLTGPAAGTAPHPLVCIAAGRPAPDPAVLAGLQSFRHMTAKLRAAYDLLLVAGPPLAADGAGLAGVAAEAEAVIAAIGPAESSRRRLRSLRASLANLDAAPLGAIVVPAR